MKCLYAQVLLSMKEGGVAPEFTNFKFKLPADIDIEDDSSAAHRKRVDFFVEFFNDLLDSGKVIITSDFELENICVDEIVPNVQKILDSVLSKYDSSGHCELYPEHSKYLVMKGAPNISFRTCLCACISIKYDNISGYEVKRGSLVGSPESNNEFWGPTLWVPLDNQNKCTDNSSSYYGSTELGLIPIEKFLESDISDRIDKLEEILAEVSPVFQQFDEVSNLCEEFESTYANRYPGLSVRCNLINRYSKSVIVVKVKCYDGKISFEFIYNSEEDFDKKIMNAIKYRKRRDGIKSSDYR